MSSLATIVMLLPTVGFAEKKLESLDAITVKGEAITSEQQPVSITTIDAKKFEELSLDRPDEIMAEVPGVELGDYNQGGTANTIAMRGFRSGAHGGDVAIFVDGVTLNESSSHSDGYADMNILIPLEINYMDVYKGPASALYGNFARAGTISLHTKKGGEYNQLKTELSSFNTHNTQVAFGRKLNDNIHNNTAIQFYRTSGYQQNSGWVKGNVSTRFSGHITDNLDAALSLRGHKSEWDAPGYIPETQYNDEDKAKLQNPNSADDGGYKNYYSQRVDLGYSISPNLRLLSWGYGTQQKFARYSKFNFDEIGYTYKIKYDTTFNANKVVTKIDTIHNQVIAGKQKEKFHDRFITGFGTSLNWNGYVQDMYSSAVFGAEYIREETTTEEWHTKDRVRGVYRAEDSTAAKSSVYFTPDEKDYEALITDQTFKVGTASFFGQYDMEVSRFFRPLVGLRLDYIHGEVVNNIPEEKQNPKNEPDVEVWDKKEMNDKFAFSPKAGFSSQVHQYLDLRASYSQGFSMPKGNARYSKENEDLDLIGIKQYEVGASLINSDLATLDVSGYILDTDNEIQKNIATDDYENVGLTRRKGVEVGASVTPLEGLELSGDGSYIEATIEENADKTKEGLHLKGVPEVNGSVGMRYTSPFKLGGGIKWHYKGESYVTDDNKITNDGYNTLKGDIFYTIKSEKGTEYRLFFKVDNILDEHYSQSMWHNGTTTNYALGKPRTFGGGIQINW